MDEPKTKRRAKKAAQVESDSTADQPVEVKSDFTLARNAGFLRGNEHVFYPAGTSFNSESDAILIAELTRLGASFE